MMDQSYSESDLSLSPSQILERLQVLRQLQLMQRGKLQKQRLHYQETSETSSSITEIVSQFSSTSYNTFRSLQTSHETSNEVTPRLDSNSLLQKVKENDLIDGVSVLNLSQESEFIIKSPISNKSRVSAASKFSVENSPVNIAIEAKPGKKHISLDEMPVLATDKNFEELALEKIESEKVLQKRQAPQKEELSNIAKKPFLKRGQGTSRFGIQKNNLVIQSTKALPWRQRNLKLKKPVGTQNIGIPQLQKNTKNKSNEKIDVQIVVSNARETSNSMRNTKPIDKQSQFLDEAKNSTESQKQESNSKELLVDSSNCEIHGAQKVSSIFKLPNEKHPLSVQNNRGKTWAAVLTNEQSDLLRQLKQSDYYKNFTSPAKSIVSDISCDENLAKLRQERECAEQNLFELLENKVDGESFSIDNSFFSKFLRKTQLECSGESTPLILQKCLARNPNLLHIVSDLTRENSQSQCQSEMDDNSTDCCSDDCCSISSSCCSCKTVEHRNQVAEQNRVQNRAQNKQTIIKYQQKVPNREEKVLSEQKETQKEHKGDDKDNTDSDTVQANMAEMNAKLVATSELLKERLQELEDEIETFRKQNSNLTKLREEVDTERQKFYAEKSAFEQKFNEEKILSEYYLAEEKEKLNKQKQMYERYVREMRGRLNKKEKDEVINLKKEIQYLKEEIRTKDAKSTSTIARLRNHIKIMEKEKKDLQDSVDKLKKENRRIQHSNDITRRLTNMKYLEQINNKLSHISSKENNIGVGQDTYVKYKAFEIEQQSRGRKVVPSQNGGIRPRAKSVPNLNVTSRYAKYFSQRDAVSQIERDMALNVEGPNTYHSPNNYDSDSDRIEELNNTGSGKSNDESGDEDQNQLEKIYLERFQSSPVTSNRSSFNNPSSGIIDKPLFRENPDGYFLRKSNSASNKDMNSLDNSLSPFPNSTNGSNTNTSKSPISILNRRSNERIVSLERLKETENQEINSQRSKSPVSILSNRSSNTQIHPSVINLSQDQFREKLMTVSPEPATISSKSSLSKTNLNPTEFKKPDGSRELRFPNGNVKYISADGKYSKFVYYNGDTKENFYDEGRIKYYYAEAKTIHTTHPDGLEVLEFPDGQVEKRYKDGSTEIRLPNGSVRYHDPKNAHVTEEWRFPDGTALTVAANGERRVTFPNGQKEVHAADHKRREFPDGTVKLVYNDGTSETRYASGRVRIKDKQGNLIMDSAG